jgi:hypothetical protein
MDPVDNQRMTAQEILSIARERGGDVEPFYTDGHFEKDQRWIFFWRKDELPYSGPAGEKEGTLHYNMQGSIAVLPSVLRESASVFRGAWTEAGTFDSIEQAFELLKAWLLDRKEVDDLPRRSVRRYGI